MRDCDVWKVGIGSGAFALLGLGALLGAIAHGFEMADGVRALLWAPLYLSLGLTVALFGTVPSATCSARGCPPRPAGPGRDRPRLLRAHPARRQVPGLRPVRGRGDALALGAYGWLAATRRLPGAGRMVGGIVLSVVAAALQASRIVPRLELLWSFDHNGIFHLVQIPALVLLALGLGIALCARPAAADVPPLSLDRA